MPFHIPSSTYLRTFVLFLFLSTGKLSLLLCSHGGNRAIIPEVLLFIQETSPCKDETLNTNSRFLREGFDWPYLSQVLPLVRVSAIRSMESHCTNMAATSCTCAYVDKDWKE